MNGSGIFPGENPFSTRRTRPGALSYLFPSDASLEQLVEQLRKNAGWGEIVGPHGSGKSTLLARLIPALKAEGWQTHLVELHDGQRRLPVNLRKIPADEGPIMLIVDGYEQLGSLSRFHLKRYCRRCGWGLIATAHQSVGLPELFRTPTSPELANRIVQELLQDQQHDYSIFAQEITNRFARHNGNLRELLFDLYDLFERRRIS